MKGNKHTHIGSYRLPMNDQHLVMNIEALVPTQTEKDLIRIIKKQDLALAELFGKLNSLQMSDSWVAKPPFIDSEGKQQPGVMKTWGVIAEECKTTCLSAGERLKE